MATDVAVDHSYARPGARTILAHGYRIAFRYLGTSRDGRAIQQPELDELHAAGIQVAFVHQANQPTAELSIKRPLTGYAGGQEDARLGNLYADNRGVPLHKPIFTPVDVGFGFPAPEHYPKIREFFLAHLDYSQRPVAAYGPYPVLEMLAGLTNNAGRRIEHFWQTAGGSGSGEGSGGSIVTGDGSRRKLSRHACAFQHYGLTRIPQTDHNDVFTDAAMWAWHPAIGDAPTEEEDPDMKPAIWWCQTDSRWMVDVGGFAPGSGPHAFMRRGGDVQHIPDMEAVEAARFELILEGGQPDPEGDNQEMPEWATVWERWNVPDASFRTVHLQGPGGIANHPHDAPPAVEVAGLVNLTEQSLTDVARAVNDEAHRRSAE